ncbi:MAG TPA: calcium/proton exchanger [Tepidisphaeraceae bacterium]
MHLLLRLGYASIPLAFAAHFLLPRHGPHAMQTWEPLITFILSGIGVIPLAHLMGRATGQLAERTGPTWGGLLNATFGNAAELIIAIIALCKGMNDVVKASLTGSILGNLLLVSGAAMLIGGWRRERQVFSKASAQTSSALLAVAVAAALLPAIFNFTFARTDVELLEHEEAMSIGTAIVLIAVYVLGLLFTLRTHSHIFSSRPAESPEDPSGVGEVWSVRRSVAALVVASVLVSLVAELLVGSVESVATTMRWNELFVGCILLAIFGNAAEQSTAVLLARRNDMDTAMTITYQSSLQIALFTTPVMVLLSAILGHFGVGHTEHRLDLIFSPMEVAAVLLSVAIVIVVGLNGETNWFEGAMLLAVYAILGITFFYIPSGKTAGYDKELSGRLTPAAPAAAVREAPVTEGMSHVTAR